MTQPPQQSPVTARHLEEDEALDESLRPRSFDEYIGQDEIKANLRIYIQAAIQRGEALDHLLLYGPPGLGKTTLAHVIAGELGARILVTSGPALDKKGALIGLMTALEDGDVLFIDEIHRLSATVEEICYPAMEDYQVEIPTGEGLGATMIPVRLSRFTLVGATTKWGSLSAPLRDRFGVVERIDYYREEDLEKIVARSSRILDIKVSEDGARQIAARSRLTPRVANRLLKRVRDFAQVEGSGVIDHDMASAALTRLGVDENGLDRLDRQYLEMLVKKFAGGPAGLDTLCAALSESRDTIEDVVEPYLLRCGLIQRTPRGRIATQSAIALTGGKGSARSQSALL